MRSVLVDFETTGLTKPAVSDLHKQPKIIEAGIVVVQDGKIVDEYGQLVWPEEDVSTEITKITGIKNEMLQGMPIFGQIVDMIAARFQGSDQLWAHNAPFDRACLEYELKRLNVVKFPWPQETYCSVQEYVHEFGRRPTLKELYQAKIGKPLEQTHRALDDLRALAEILIKEGLI